ncbi:MATE family efflux transporter [Oceaniserpentilla sp. 4NH20-0058]|uniref:MATE family efflux transporter n=1 Tax=Oceaniserpentilla sp. 4NH20-0058 TaxID=3127660 RepID=UPI0031084F13
MANVLLASIGVVQIVLATDFGPEATAAVAVSQRVFFVLQASLFGLATGISALIARSVGANQLLQAAQTVQSAMLLGFIVSTSVGALCYVWASEIASVFNLEGQTHSLATNLIHWVCIFNPIYALNIVLAASMRASGDAKNPLLLAFISSVGNWIGSAALAYGWWGLPAWEVEGLAIGGISGSVLALILYTLLWRIGKLRVPYPDMSAFRLKTNKILRVGTPSAIEQTLMHVGFMVYMVAIAHYGSDVLAGYGLGLNILTMITLLSLGFSMASAVIVGQYLGRGEPETAEKYGWKGWRLCIGIMLGAALIFAVFSQELAQLLTTEKAVQTYTALFFTVVAIALPFIATDFALGGAIRGAGETTYPLKVSMISLILVRFIMPFVFLEMEFSINTMFLLTALDFGIKAVFMMYYFRSGKWKHKAL